MTALSSYITQTRRLVRDQAGQFFTQSAVIDAVNGGRTQVAKVTGCIRALVPGSAPYGAQATVDQAVVGAMIVGLQGNSLLQTSVFNTIAGLEVYPFSFANGLVRATYNGCSGILAVHDVAVSWGGAKPTLGYLPWDELQAYGRSYNINRTSYPFYWSVMNDGQRGQVWLFPAPVQALEMEWDCNLAPAPMYADSDTDVIPEPFDDAVKYWAARLLYLQSSRFGMAELMKEQFKEHLVIDRYAADPGKVQDYYWTQDVL